MNQPQTAHTWPGSAGSSIQELIHTLRVAGEADAKNLKPTVTPYSLEVIRAGETFIAKRWTVWVAAAGGLPALAALVAGVTSNLGIGDPDPLVRAAFVVSGSVLLSTVAIAIAIIVKSDVTGRALGTAAQKQAEANIAVAALSSYQYALTTPSYLIKKKDGSILKADAFKIEAGQLCVSSAGANIPDQDIDYLIEPQTMKP